MTTRPNDMPMWRDATWKERIGLVALWSFMWGIIFPAMALGGLFVVGTMVEGYTVYKTELSRCQKHAATPYEYHQCR
jgi:hypothetical protein